MPFELRYHGGQPATWGIDNNMPGRGDLEKVYGISKYHGKHA